MGGYNIDEVLFDPLGVFLTRCKSAKTLSKWVLCTLFGGLAFLPFLSGKWSKGWKTSHKILRRSSHMSSHKWRRWITLWPNLLTLVFRCVVAVLTSIFFFRFVLLIFFFLAYSLRKRSWPIWRTFVPPNHPSSSPPSWVSSNSPPRRPLSKIWSLVPRHGMPLVTSSHTLSRKAPNLCSPSLSLRMWSRVR